LPKDQRSEFLAGYTDSDGYVTDKRKSNMLIFRSVNQKLIWDLRNLVIYCDLHPSNIHLIKSKHPFDKKRVMYSYQIEISGDVSQIRSRYPFKNLRLNSKKLYLTFRTAKNTVFRKHTNEFIGYAKIKSIRPLGIETVYDIEVQNYHNFIAEGLIVHNSNVVYHKLKEEWEKLGVVFLDMDEAVRQYPELVKEYFMTKCVPINDHKFAALHGAVWSGGTFIYIPKGVKVTMPLQAYFRMNAKSAGQFEHTLIIADRGSEVHYLEGCSAPLYNTNSLHAGCVEIYVREGAKVRYSSVENWSKNTYNLNTKRAIVEKDGVIEWVSGNMGSNTTMLYPCSILKGERAKAEHISLAVAGENQNQDTGAKVIHLAKNTASTIKSKSISLGGGITSYRGLLKIVKGAEGSKSHVQCDALIMDEISKSNTFPTMQVMEEKVDVAHEATVGKISEEQIFYLMSRGISAEEALRMVVVGFMNSIVKELPLEYAVEMNRLIELEMEGSVG